MAMSDLRAYIGALEGLGELQRIEREVDWSLELGGVIRRSYDLRAPAPFFLRVKDTPPGFRALGAPLGLSSNPGRAYARLATSLGLDPATGYVDLMERFIEKRRSRIKPVIVEGGPCKENVRRGEEVDLEMFPVPWIHEGDGGRYIGTWHAFITKDPETGWTNWGMYRMMLHDKRSTGLWAGASQHGSVHLSRYWSRGEPMPFAVALGTEPVTPIVCSLRIAPLVNEADVIGGLRGEPLELVKCETVDLYVPATSEIVLEGKVYPDDREMEGPFGEYTGYRAAERSPRPVCRVECVTFRNDPILPVTCMGTPVDDAAALRPLVVAEILDDLRQSGYPIRMVYSPPEAMPTMLFVSSQVPYPHYPRNLADAIFGNPATRGIHSLFLFDEDVDVTHTEEALWAFSTRCHPERGIHKMSRTAGSPLHPWLSTEERKSFTSARVLLDCTWPKDWKPEEIPVKASFDVMWPKEIQEKVLMRWLEYGYGTS
jgi:4-hydroxy-3-polyprenylbenzoate decarboxylase